MIETLKKGEPMRRYAKLMVALLAVVCSVCAASPRLLAAATPAPESRQLLSRWRQTRDMVKRGAVPADQLREAAMVLAWGQPLEYLEEGEDAEMLDLIKERLGTPDFARQQLAQALADLDAEGDSFAARRGGFLTAFVSTVDDSGQIYLLQMPADYDPDRQYPLEVRPSRYLNYQGHYEPEKPLDRFVVALGGRGQNGIEGLDELEALEVIRDVRKHYHIDPDRIYLTGGSAGGTGAWRLAARYPDLFAAAAVDYGFTWTSVLYLENVSNLPMWVYHDETDTFWVPVDESRTAFRFLSDMAFPIIYLETSGGGHSGQLKDPAWDTPGWLLRQRRERYPDRVFYTTATPARGRAYWLEILEFSDPNALATVRAQVRRQDEQTQLFLNLANVDVLRVDLPGSLFPGDRMLSVTSGGAPVTVSPPLPSRIYLRQQGDPNRGGRLTVSNTDPREPKPFRPYTAGGLNWMYTSGEPLMIVRGTGGDGPELLAAIARYCRLLSSRNTGWWPFQMTPFMLGQIPVKADTEVTAEDVQRCNLIIVGPASANRLLARITSRLPAVEESGLLRVGPEQYELKGNGYGLFHYNPEAPQRLIMVMSSPEAEFYRSVTNGIADRMGDERPLGLVVMQLSPLLTVRQIMWDKDWRAPKEAFTAPRLPEAFAAKGSSVQHLYHRAMRSLTGAEFTVYWRGNEEEADRSGRWDVSRAPWSDLATDMGQARTLLVGSASGADLLALARADTVKVGVDPGVDDTTIVPGDRYRICMDPRLAWAFVRATGHGVGDSAAVRVDLFPEVQRLVIQQRP
jgi:predicted esterase